MRTLAAELRDWTAFAMGGVGLYLTWRRRPQRERSDVTIYAPAAEAIASVPTPAILNLSPSHGTSSASLALTTGL